VFLAYTAQAYALMCIRRTKRKELDTYCNRLAYVIEEKQLT
jgi:hypothetical protein